jgi:hypothetical protein
MLIESWLWSNQWGRKKCEVTHLRRETLPGLQIVFEPPETSSMITPSLSFWMLLIRTNLAH